MQNFKKSFLISCLVVILSTSFQTANAANIFGVYDPPGCESKDKIFPSLVVCGRNPASGACPAYTKQCNLGDLVETGSRAIIFIITLALLIVPLIIMYYGAMIIINQQLDGGINQLKKLKDNFWRVLVYFLLMLAAWLIVRTVVDVFQVRSDINTFLIDKDGTTVKARPFPTN